MMEKIENILPNLQFSVLCDDVIQDITTGKFVLHGLFANISGSAIPLVHPKFFIVNGWCNGDGTFQQKTKILHPNKTVMLEDKFSEFHLKDSRAKHTVVTQFNNIMFKETGIHWVEIHLSNRLMLSYPFDIRQEKPKR